MVVEIQINASTETLQKRHRAGLHGGTCCTLLHGLIDVILTDGAMKEHTLNLCDKRDEFRSKKELRPLFLLNYRLLSQMGSLL